MKKKSILLTCICALMALAMFVGCEQASVFPHFPATATIRQVGDFVEGQIFDASKFVVDVTYLDGSRSTITDAALTYTDDDDIPGVSSADTVSVNVGNDYYGDPVDYTANISRIYQISYVTLSTAETSFALPATAEDGEFTVSSELFTVNAYCSGLTEPIVLSPADYTVTVNVDTEAEGYAYATSVTGVATVAKSDNGHINFPSEGATCSVTVSKEAAPQITVSELTGISTRTTYSLPKYNYGSVANLPEIDLSDVVVLYTDSEGKQNQTTEASKIDADFEIVYTNQYGEALDDKYDDVNFVEASTSNIYLQLVVGGKNVGEPRQTTLSDVTIELVYAGNGYTEGTKLADIDFSNADFRVYSTVNGETTNITSEIAADDFFFADSKDSEEATSATEMPAYDSTPGFGGIWLGVDYMGVKCTDNVFIESTKGVPSVTGVTFNVDSSFTIAGQYYDSLNSLTISAVDIESVTVTTSDGSDSELTAADFQWNLYTDAEGKNLLSSLTATEYGYDLVNNNVYVGATYDGKLYMNATAFTKSGASNVVDRLRAVVTSEDPTVGSTATVTVIAYNEDGIFDLNYTAYDVIDSIGTIITGDNPFDNLNLGAAPVEYIIAATSNKQVEATVTIPAGIGYIEPTDAIEVALKIENEKPVSAQAAVGSTISLDLIKSFYEVDAETYDVKIGSTTPALPEITSMEPVYPSQRIEQGENTFSVNITYVGENGETATATDEVTIEGVAYVTSMDAKPVLLYQNEVFKAFEQGESYNLVDFSISADSFESVGEVTISNPSATCTDTRYVTDTTVTGDMSSNYTFTFTYTSTSALAEATKVLDITLGVYTE